MSAIHPEGTYKNGITLTYIQKDNLQGANTALTTGSKPRLASPLDSTNPQICLIKVFVIQLSRR